MSQPNITTDRLSIIRDLVGRVGIDVQFAETEDEIRGYLKAKLKDLRREGFFLAL